MIVGAFFFDCGGLEERNPKEYPFVVDRHPRDGGYLVNHANTPMTFVRNAPCNHIVAREHYSSPNIRLERLDESSRIILSNNGLLRLISLAKYTRVIIYIVGRMPAIDIVNQELR